MAEERESKFKWWMAVIVIPIVLVLIPTITDVLKKKNEQSGTCTPGEARDCHCEGSGSGVQICAENGLKYYLCRCESQPSISKEKPIRTQPSVETPSPEPIPSEAKTKPTAPKSRTASVVSPGQAAHERGEADTPPKKVTGSAECKGTRCRLNGDVPSVANVCLDATDSGGKKNRSTCTISKHSVHTCDRLGKDNQTPLLGNITWRSPCP